MTTSAPSPSSSRVWVDLVDPDEAALTAALPAGLHDSVIERLKDPTRHSDQPRPRLESHGGYVIGVVVLPERSGAEVVSRAVDVVLTGNCFYTIHNESTADVLIELGQRVAAAGEVVPAMVLYFSMDLAAERFLSMVDEFDFSINELEDHVDDLESRAVRKQIGDLRHAILHTRRVLVPTRDTCRVVVDDRLDLESGLDMFDHSSQLFFADVYDKLLRAADSLDLCRDLLAGVRDYHQAEVANNQNEVMKRLTVIASVLLLPTFIVGLYGQNLKGMPESGFRYGYAFSWGLIITTTIAQLIFFRKKRWI